MEPVLRKSIFRDTNFMRTLLRVTIETISGGPSLYNIFRSAHIIAKNHWGVESQIESDARNEC